MIKELSIDIVGYILVCKTILNESVTGNNEFAFYVFRNGQRVHTVWYTKRADFEFDTENIPGIYKIQVFVKFDENSTETVSSSLIFMNPIEVSLDSFSGIENQVACLLKGEFWNIPAFYCHSENKVLFVMMPSAINREKAILPIFSRWTWALKGMIAGNVLCIADPTLNLHNELKLGWCIGDATHDATTEIAKFVVKLAKFNNIPNNKIVIYGSSAGGFAALALSAFIEGSIAVAINSQTDALAYESSKQVALICQCCFENMQEDTIRLCFSDRVNMVSRWKNINVSRVFMVQNTLDGHHWEKHYQPFAKAMGLPLKSGISKDGRHRSLIYDDPRGHIPESPEIFVEIMRNINEMLNDDTAVQ
ncbi:MAG: hypothetical protein LBG21_07295 [Campylobacteraceae bacterium]|jgi:hypothetical protein|nr:hypothetical protein [Campylobacteraceae bacterium]